MNYYTVNTARITRTLFIVLLLCCMSLFAIAQRHEFVLKGVMFKLGTTQRLAKVLVANQNNNAIVSSDDLGVFEIKCAMGDSLLFRQKDYADQKKAVTTEATIMVYMQSSFNLAEVNIKGQTKKQELQQVMGEYNSQGIYGNGKTSVMGTLASPINALFDVFGSGPKQARRFQRYSANELEQTQVDKRFTRPLVQRITGLSDTTKLNIFVLAYKPSYQDIKAWNDYELINYIKKSYTDFEKNGQVSPPNLPKLLPAVSTPVSLGGH